MSEDRIYSVRANGGYGGASGKAPDLIMTKTDLKQIATPREMVLTALVTVVIIFFFSRILWTPKATELAGLKSQIKGLVTEKEAMAKFVDAVAAHPPEPPPSNTGNIDPKTEVIMGQKTPEVVDAPSLMAKVTDPAFLYGVQLDSFKFLDATEEKGFSKRSFIIEARGTFSAIASLVEKIEKMPALITANQFSLEQDDEKPGEVTLKLEGTIYQALGSSNLVDKKS